MNTYGSIYHFFLTNNATVEHILRYYAKPGEQLFKQGYYQCVILS